MTTQKLTTVRVDLLEAIGRGWCHPDNPAKVVDPALAISIAEQVEPLIAVVEAERDAARREARAARNLLHWDGLDIRSSDPEVCTMEEEAYAAARAANPLPETQQ